MHDSFRARFRWLGDTGSGSSTTLPHFNATSLLVSGTDVRAVSGRLGHATAATTLGVFAHLLEAGDGKPAEPLRSVIHTASGRHR